MHVFYLPVVFLYRQIILDAFRRSMWARALVSILCRSPKRPAPSIQRIFRINRSLVFMARCSKSPQNTVQLGSRWQFLQPWCAYISFIWPVKYRRVNRWVILVQC